MDGHDALDFVVRLIDVRRRGLGLVLRNVEEIRVRFHP